MIDYKLGDVSENSSGQVKEYTEVRLLDIEPDSVTEIDSPSSIIKLPSPLVDRLISKKTPRVSSTEVKSRVKVPELVIDITPMASPASEYLPRRCNKWNSTVLWNADSDTSNDAHYSNFKRSNIECKRFIVNDSLSEVEVRKDYAESLMNKSMLSSESQVGEIQRSKSLTTHTIREEWLDGMDMEFLEQMDLNQTEDEAEFKKHDLENYDDVFFKNFDILRKQNLVLNSQLPRLDHQGKIRAMFKSHGTQIRIISKAVQKCHKYAHRIFNFQRNCMLVCSEALDKDEAYAKDMKVDYVSETTKKTFNFKVSSWSVINSLSLWDFSAFQGGGSDFQIVSELSPYLSLTSKQWKSALTTDRPGRSIMIYEPVTLKALHKQGVAATHRAEKLKEIHSKTKFLKLILAEYISLNQTYLKHGSTFSGVEVICQLLKDRKNWDLFNTMPQLEADIRNCEFLLNPKISEGIDLIPSEDRNSSIKEKHSKRIIFLCDPTHWTLYMQTLLRKRIDALISTLAKIAELKDEDFFDLDIEGQIKNVKTLAMEHVSQLRKFVSVLPEPQNLDKYVSESQSKYFSGTERLENDNTFGMSRSLSEASKPLVSNPSLSRAHHSVVVGKTMNIYL